MKAHWLPCLAQTTGSRRSVRLGLPETRTISRGEVFEGITVGSKLRERSAYWVAPGHACTNLMEVLARERVVKLDRRGGCDHFGMLGWAE